MVRPHRLLGSASFRPERLGFHHDRIDIRTLALIAAPTGAEQDDLLRIDLVDDGLNHAIQKCIGHRLHRLVGADFDSETTSGEWVPYVKEVEPAEVPVVSVEPPHPVEAKKRGKMGIRHQISTH